jgi:hypothetical protein
MESRQIITVVVRNIKYVSALCRKTAGLINVTSFGIYIHHKALIV